MQEPMMEELVLFNRIYKEMDQIYHMYAKQCGLSDASLWLLYSLCERETYTQREICAAWHYPPQTINSALKALEKQGFIVLEPIAGNQKNKLVVLTQEGEALKESVICPLILAEQEAFAGLSKRERESLLMLTKKYVELLQGAVNRQ